MATTTNHPCTFAYDGTGKIWAAKQSDTPDPNWDTSWSTLTLDDTSTPTGATVFSDLTAYTIQSGAAVLLPYFSLAQSTTSGVTTVTATLLNAPTTPPTNVTFTAAGQSFTAPVSSGAASADFTLDAMVASQAVGIVVTAPGFKRGRITLGVPTGATDHLQAIAPGATGNPSTTAWRIATTSKAAAAEYYLAQAQADLSSILASLQVLVQMVVSDLYKTGGVLDNLSQSAYTPITVSADAANALTDLRANLLPSVGWTLDNVYPYGGTPLYHYASTKAHIAGTTSAAQAYAAYVAQTPNLN